MHLLILTVSFLLFTATCSVASSTNWFFALRVPTENRPGVFFTFVKGPYQNELECWEDHDEAKEMMLGLGVDEEDIVDTGCVGDDTQKV